MSAVLVTTVIANGTYSLEPIIGCDENKISLSFYKQDLDNREGTLATLWNWWRSNSTVHNPLPERNIRKDHATVRHVQCIDNNEQLTKIYCGKRSKKCLSVQFSEVHIREYEVTLGDHPKPKLYPISLDWTYGKYETTMNIEQHVDLCTQKRLQRVKEKSKCISRSSSFRLTPAERFKRMTDVGNISTNELFHMEEQRQKQAKKDRNLKSCDDCDEDEHDIVSSRKKKFMSLKHKET